MSLNLYLLEQSINDNYDTYDSCIVAAEGEEEAKLIHPSQYPPKGWPLTDERSDWALPEHVSVTLIGTAAPGIKPGVVLASFNAG